MVTDKADSVDSLERDKCMDNLIMVMECLNPRTISILHRQQLLADLEERLVFDRVLGPNILARGQRNLHKANSTRQPLVLVTCKTCLEDPQAVSQAKHSSLANNLPTNKELETTH